MAKKLHEVQEQYRATTVGLCLICDKPVQGWYGRWGDLGTCSKACEAVQEAKPKYEGTKPCPPES